MVTIIFTNLIFYLSPYLYLPLSISSFDIRISRVTFLWLFFSLFLFTNGVCVFAITIDYQGNDGGGGYNPHSNYSPDRRPSHHSQPHGSGQSGHSMSHRDLELMENVGRNSTIDPHSVLLFRSRAEYLSIVGIDIFEDQSVMININDREEYEHQQRCQQKETENLYHARESSRVRSRSRDARERDYGREYHGGSQRYDSRDESRDNVPRSGGRYEAVSYRQGYREIRDEYAYPDAMTRGDTHRGDRAHRGERGGESDGYDSRRYPKSVDRSQSHVFSNQNATTSNEWTMGVNESSLHDTRSRSNSPQRRKRSTDR